jgi:hypothetical protein
LRPNFIAVCLDETEDRAQQPRNLGNVGLNVQAASGRTDCQPHTLPISGK